MKNIKPLSALYHELGLLQTELTLSNRPCQCVLMQEPCSQSRWKYLTKQLSLSKHSAGCKGLINPYKGFFMMKETSQGSEGESMGARYTHSWRGFSIGCIAPTAPFISSVHLRRGTSVGIRKKIQYVCQEKFVFKDLISLFQTNTKDTTSYTDTQLPTQTHNFLHRHTTAAATLTAFKETTFYPQSGKRLDLIISELLTVFPFLSFHMRVFSLVNFHHRLTEAECVLQINLK